MSHISLELLDKMLVGQTFTADDVDTILKDQIGEDQYLEYKHGDELLKKDANDTIRKYVGGFANSEGGILIIGIKAPNGIPQEVTGCNGHSKNQLEEWAARCLTPIANHLSPPPRIQSMVYHGKELLIVASPRSIGLVPYVKAGQISYYLRLHDQTLHAPEYLVADLLLGRRQQPNLEIVDYAAHSFNRIPSNEKGTMDLKFHLQFNFENSSIVWAEESKWGIIAWTLDVDNRYSMNVSYLTNNLLSYLDVKGFSSKNYSAVPQKLHISSPISIDRPFEPDRRAVVLTIPLRIHQEWFTYTCKAAVYLVAKNSLPIWYQVSLSVNIDTVKLVNEGATLDSSQAELMVSKLHKNERPIVAWDGI